MSSQIETSSSKCAMPVQKSPNRLIADWHPVHRPTDRHPPARYTANQTRPQPPATRPPNQPVVVSYPRGYHPDNQRGRLDPGMLDQAPKGWSLPIIDEFKMIKHKREKFFVPGKVHSRCPLFEPFCTDNVRCL